jgi:membrane protease subunit HflK
VTQPVHTPDSGAAALGDALRLTFRLMRIALLLALLAYLASGLFIVPQHERAFVLRFGRAIGTGADRTKEPGLHWTWPRPFSEIVRVPTERVQTMTSRSFWPAHGGGTGSQMDTPDWGDALRPGQDGYALSGDANLLHHRWALRYTITDPFAWTFTHREPETLLLDELDRAVVRVSARFAIDRALRTGIAAYRDAVEFELRPRLDALGVGVRLQGVDLLGIVPPAQVAAAFDAVTQAAQARAELISDARAYAVRASNEAAGEGDRRIAAGEADRQNRASEVASRADAYAALLPAWRKHPRVVERTLRQDAVREALARVERKILANDGQELRLNFGAPPRWIPEAHE